MKAVVAVWLTLAGPAFGSAVDIAPFALPCCAADEHKLQTAFDYGHSTGTSPHPGGGYAAGLQWREARDISEVVVHFASPYQGETPRVQYWWQNWPDPKPKDHTMEDPADDPWQGRWLTAAATASCESRQCRFRFKPLAADENPRAANFPGVDYRRTLKLRLLFAEGNAPQVQSLEVFTPSAPRQFTFHVQFCQNGSAPAPRLEVYNGTLRQVKVAGCEATATVDGMEPHPAGSNDVTLVKVRAGSRAFTFAPANLDAGPTTVRNFGVTLRADSAAAAKPAGKRIRERLSEEPEQSYERASKEIPALDPAGHVRLPLAADASWQKFELMWGGHVRISKKGTKAYGRELARLTWPGDEIQWRVGTGAQPTFRPASQDSNMSQLEDSLPVITTTWESNGLVYEQETFATLLDGPLSPEGMMRNEQTPAVLMMRVSVNNRTNSSQAAHLWMTMRPAEALAFDGRLLTAGESVRAAVVTPDGMTASIGACDTLPALHLEGTLPAQGEVTGYFAIPFIPGMTATERARLTALDFTEQRERVVAYWRELTRNAVPFEVPEERFNTFARGLVARIRISTTKDPKSGLYMVPAASLNYKVYANEAAFQCQLLDALGQHELAGRYLRSLATLQGSKPLEGTFTGDQRDVYYGARVDKDYDYTATPYNLAHGTVLGALAEHYTFSHDRRWLDEMLPGMKRAARWIEAQRALTMKAQVNGEHAPEYGLLPAGHLEDNHDWGHWFSVNAYASEGMTALARVLTEIGDGDAAEFAREASAYRDDLRAAVARAAEDAAIVRLRDGTAVPYVPTRVHQRLRQFGPLRNGYYSRYDIAEMPTFRLSATRELLYGPLTLLDTGIFGVDEPLAAWILDDWEDNQTMSEPLNINVHGRVDEEYWFSRGGMVFQANLQNPVRAYIRRGEVRAALRGLYNNFVSCYYPQVNVLTEEYRRWRFPSGPFFKVADEARFTYRLRDLLVTEINGQLHLARATPAAWLADGKEIVVQAAPTEFGPVSYRLRAENGAVTGMVTLPAGKRYTKAWLSVRVPEDRSISEVRVNGAAWKDVDPATGAIALPETTQPISVTVSTQPRAFRAK